MRRSGFVFFWLVIGIAAGIGAGLFYAWQVDPIVETRTQPYQLRPEDKQRYMIALSLAFAQDRDVVAAAERLIALRINWQDLADKACELTQIGYTGTSTGLIVVRAMVDLAGTQGASGCASVLIQVATPPPIPTTAPLIETPSPLPFVTKTPTLGPTFTPFELLATATPTPAGDFALLPVESICNAELQNVIQIIVQDQQGNGIPGAAVEVIWTDGRERFFTGLKPDRDPGYADFEMTPGETYQVLLPGISERSRRLEAGECQIGGGETALAAYRVTFRRAR